MSVASSTELSVLGILRKKFSIFPCLFILGLLTVKNKKNKKQSNSTIILTANGKI